MRRARRSARRAAEVSPSPGSTPATTPRLVEAHPARTDHRLTPTLWAWGRSRSPARPPPAPCDGRAARFPARHSAGPHRRRRTRRSPGGGWRSGTGPPARRAWHRCPDRGRPVARGSACRRPEPGPGPRIPLDRFRRNPRDRGDGSFNVHVALLIARRRVTSAAMLPAPAASRPPPKRHWLPSGADAFWLHAPRWEGRIRTVRRLGVQPCSRRAGPSTPSGG